MLAIKVCNHFQHQIWITSHYRLLSKVQTWPYWPDQTSFLPPWIFWKLLYGKCTLNHLNAGKFPIQPLSRQTNIHKFTDAWQCISLCVFTLAPLPSIHFSPSMTGGGRGNGRDHYITKHPQATVLSNCHIRLPKYCLQASGQVLCGTLQMQGGWEEKIEWQTERNRRKDGKEEREWDRREGGIETKHHVAGLSSPSGSKPQLLLLDTLDICVSMTQIMFAWTWKDCRKSKVRLVWWMLHWLVPPPSFFLTPQRPGTYLLLAMNSTNWFNQ